jgi:hypothetical protein
MPMYSVSNCGGVGPGHRVSGELCRVQSQNACPGFHLISQEGRIAHLNKSNEYTRNKNEVRTEVSTYPSPMTSAALSITPQYSLHPKGLCKFSTAAEQADIRLI